MRWVDSRGDAHDLPKLTRSLAKQIERAEDERDADARWKAQLAVLAEVLGDETDAVLGGRTLDTVDVSALEAAFVGVATAYEAPRMAAEAERVEARLASMDVERLKALADVMDSLGGRQGFRNVR